MKHSSLLIVALAMPVAGSRAAEPMRQLTALRHRFRLVSSVSPEHWREGPGQLVGGLPAKAVEACFCPQAAVEVYVRRQPAGDLVQLYEQVC